MVIINFENNLEKKNKITITMHCSCLCKRNKARY